MIEGFQSLEAVNKLSRSYKMGKHNEVGKKGELIAIKYLKSKGYLIRKVNYRFSKAEIDIIAEVNKVLVFVEVKTRTSSRHGQPYEFVTRKKELLLSAAASNFMDKYCWSGEIRFDVLSILLYNEFDYTITHISDAFFPGL